MSKKKKNNNNKSLRYIVTIFLVLIFAIVEYYNGSIASGNITNEELSSTKVVSFDLNSIPKYKDSPYVVINDNIPSFNENDYKGKVFEEYSELDALGRCSVAYASICKEIMPEGKRESISSIKPTGWRTDKYPGLVDGNYLYNRCHLIGYQLAGENANKKNLITGTRYMNVQGMLPFENEVDEYIEKNTKNHVLYKVTPIFEGDNLVASGVQMEAYSVEDQGKGVCFNVYVYNVQPGITINYKTGESKLEE